GPGDEDDADGLVDEAVEDQADGRAEPELVERHEYGGPVQQPHDDRLAVDGGHARHANVDPPAVQRHADAAVLGQAALGDVQLGHQLDARGDGGLQAPRRCLQIVEDAVDAIAHPQGVFRGLDVDVGGFGRDSL